MSSGPESACAPWAEAVEDQLAGLPELINAAGASVNGRSVRHVGGRREGGRDS